jgi:hypothetical protein
MSDEKKSLAVAVYQDAASPAVKEVGGVVGRVVHLAIGPVRALVYGGERIEAWITENVVPRLKSVNPEQIVAPPPEVAVPLLTAVAYTQADELRNMFASLLASAMNGATSHGAHPAFVDVIRQMSPTDARVLNVLTTVRGQTFENPGGLATPSTVTNRATFEMSLANLARLGLIAVRWSESDLLIGLQKQIIGKESIRVGIDGDPSQPQGGTLTSGEGRILDFTAWGAHFVAACLDNA